MTDSKRSAAASLVRAFPGHSRWRRGSGQILHTCLRGEPAWFSWQSGTPVLANHGHLAGNAQRPTLRPIGCELLLSRDTSALGGDQQRGTVDRHDTDSEWPKGEGTNVVTNAVVGDDQEHRQLAKGWINRPDRMACAERDVARREHRGGWASCGFQQHSQRLICSSAKAKRC